MKTVVFPDHLQPVSQTEDKLRLGINYVIHFDRKTKKTSWIQFIGT